VQICAHDVKEVGWILRIISIDKSRGAVLALQVYKLTYLTYSKTYPLYLLSFVCMLIFFAFYFFICRRTRHLKMITTPLILESDNIVNHPFCHCLDFYVMKWILYWLTILLGSWSKPLAFKIHKPVILVQPFFD